MYRWISVKERMPTEKDADEAGRILFRWRDKENPSDIGMDIVFWENLDIEIESLKEDGRCELPYWMPLKDSFPKPKR